MEAASAIRLRQVVRLEPVSPWKKLISRFELAKSTGAIHVPSLIPESHMTYRNFLSIPSHMIHERVAKLSTADWPYLLTISTGEAGETKLNVSNPNDPLRKSFWGCP